MLGVSMGFYLFLLFMMELLSVWILLPTLTGKAQGNLFILCFGFAAFPLGRHRGGLSFGVVLLQSILAGISTFALSEYLRQECRLKEVEAFFCC